MRSLRRFPRAKAAFDADPLDVGLSQEMTFADVDEIHGREWGES
jgi:hypothetical protein